MSDVMKIAQEKRARLMAEVEAKMGEVEKLDNFIMFGARLSAETGDQDTKPAVAAE